MRSQMGNNVFCNLANNGRRCSLLFFKTVLFVVFDVDTSVNANGVRFRIHLRLENINPVEIGIFSWGIS